MYLPLDGKPAPYNGFISLKNFLRFISIIF